jgi:hypothetical protein
MVRKVKPPTSVAAARIADSAVERPQELGYPSWCPGLSLLEEEIRHVRLNVVRVGVDGRCAGLRGCYELDEKRLRNAGNGDREGTEPTVESAFLCDFRPSP